MAICSSVPVHNPTSQSRGISWLLNCCVFFSIIFLVLMSSRASTVYFHTFSVTSQLWVVKFAPGKGDAEPDGPPICIKTIKTAAYAAVAATTSKGRL
jgi:hypothetical protein